MSLPPPLINEPLNGVPPLYVITWEIFRNVTGLLLFLNNLYHESFYSNWDRKKCYVKNKGIRILSGGIATRVPSEKSSELHFPLDLVAKTILHSRGRHYLLILTTQAGSQIDNVLSQL